MKMRRLHVHLHIDRELLADPESAIHIHLKPEGSSPRQPSIQQASIQQAVSQPSVPERSTIAAFQADAEPSYAAEVSGRSDGVSKAAMQYDSTGMQVMGVVGPLAEEQRIRSKFYRVDVVPSVSPDQTFDAMSALDFDTSNGMMLELATGSQVNPVVWESFAPDSQRGLWRLCVHIDFDRLLGTLTSARDHRAIWVVSQWSPRGTLILEPAEPQRYPRLMLQPKTLSQ